MFPHPETFSEREVNELIQARVKYISANFKGVSYMLMTTAEVAELPPKFYKKYDAIFVDEP